MGVANNVTRTRANAHIYTYAGATYRPAHAYLCIIIHTDRTHDTKRVSVENWWSLCLCIISWVIEEVDPQK